MNTRHHALAWSLWAATSLLGTACSGADPSSPQEGAGETAESAVTASTSSRSVCGAATGTKMRCHALVRTDPTGLVAASATPSGLGPSDLKAAYRVPEGGWNATIAIVDAFDNPAAEADMATYRAQYGLPACTTQNGCFRKVNQAGNPSPPPSRDDGWGTEISLDLDMASAICPNCKILLVEANDNDGGNLAAAVDTAVRLGATVVSNSYGGGESSGQESHYTHPGVLITASSGDSGFGVAYPASSPHVVAVGGTTLTRASTTARGWTETAWSGSGSGCSGTFSKPSWQADTGCSKRMVADVSAVADPNTGPAIYDSHNRGWIVVGGTSASSPIVASIFALIGKGAADASFAYAHPYGLFDVTSGKNGTCSVPYQCTAGVGYDGPTGLGSPDASALMAVDAMGAPADYDGDGKVDIALKDPGGVWRIDFARNGFGLWDESHPAYGGSWSIPAVADYDGDGKADISVKDTSGTWYIDYARDGFGGWNNMYGGYGGSWSTAVPADYDGDGKADLSVKDTSGTWYIDYASDGFGGWNAIYGGYGGTSTPVPADYDGDHKADLSVKDGSGTWYIDYARDGFGGWNAIYGGYGATSTAVPADYDGDGKADLSVKDGSGTWYIDYARDGFGGWNNMYGGYGGSWSTPLPGDYDGDHKADLSAKDTSGTWYIDYASDGFGAWNWMNVVH